MQRIMLSARHPKTFRFLKNFSYTMMHQIQVKSNVLSNYPRRMRRTEWGSPCSCGSLRALVWSHPAHRSRPWVLEIPAWNPETLPSLMILFCPAARSCRLPNSAKFIEPFFDLNCQKRLTSISKRRLRTRLTESRNNKTSDAAASRPGYAGYVSA